MNERLRQLMVQADYPAPEIALRAQKLAELIVRECAQAFEAEVDTWKEMNPYQGSMKRKGTQAIRKHFGVEE